jgi:hypothetical protein
MPFGKHGWFSTGAGDAPLPYGTPGPMTAAERFMFETAGFLIIPGALCEAEVAACTAAAERVHGCEQFVSRQLAQQGPPGERNGEHHQGDGGLLDCWRQLDNVWECEHGGCFEALSACSGRSSAAGWRWPTTSHPRSLGVGRVLVTERGARRAFSCVCCLAYRSRPPERDREGARAVRGLVHSAQ